MKRSLSSKELSEFLSNFIIEPIYVRSPYGEVFVLTKLAFIDICDEEGNIESLSPLIYSDETDLRIAGESGSSLIDMDDMIPPS